MKTTHVSRYEEFFYQGDEERKLGLPLSANLMDRANEPEIPSMQIGFFSAIVIPAFELMAAVLPETSALFNNVIENREHWKELMDSKCKYQPSAGKY